MRIHASYRPLSSTATARAVRALFWISASFFVLAVGFLNPVAAQDSTATTIPTVLDPRTPEIQKQIQANYDEMNEGFARFDAGAATKYFARDYHILGKDDRPMTLAQVKELDRQLFSHLITAKVKTEITLCIVVGDTATVQTHVTSLFYGRTDSGQDVQMDSENHGRSFWVKRKGFWQVKQEHDFDFTINRNGQAFIQ